MRKSSILAAIMGNVIEWYDLTLYVFLAPVIAHNFFSKLSPVNALLSTFLIFAMGFFIRPLGSVILGHLGDRFGRKVTLKITILMISLPTIAIALLPTDQQWGFYASLCLVVFRLLQGLCIGGEFAGSMIYLTETAHAHRRAFVSSMANNGSNFGVLCATLIAAALSSIFSESAFYAYGWRIAFMFGGVIGLLGLWLRRNIDETPIFDQLLAQSKITAVPLLTILKQHKKSVLHVFLLVVMAATGSYVLIDFMSTYLHQYFHYSLKNALQIQALYNGLTFLLVTLSARFSDRYGRRALLLTSALGYIVCSIPCFYLLKTTGSWIWLLPLVILYCIEESTTPAAMVELFPAAVRYTGISMGYNFSMALFGGTAPLINTWLVARFNNPLIIAYYLAASALISLLTAILFLPNQFGETCDLLHDSNSGLVEGFKKSTANGLSCSATE